MRVQKVIFESKYCEENQLFYRSGDSCEPKDGRIYIPKDVELRTNTYQNIFDEKTWQCYTGISLWFLKLSIKGSGTIHLFREYGDKKELVIQSCFETEHMQDVILPFRTDTDEGYCYFEIHTTQETIITEAGYYTNTLPKRDINLCILSCTYHRNEEINRNIDQILASDFFDETTPYFHHLRMVISDNGSELEEKNSEFLKIYHNPNTGGSGGFTRCLQELRSQYADMNITNVIFMDDDVEFLDESLYRLFALLSYVKDTYKDSVIAGRMFRTDRRWIQYTAAEIWNAGDLRHIGLNTDMCETTLLDHINDNDGAEYGGWWFCCFPYAFAKENDPLPFFLHCDDVEYGLRHGGIPIILNGIHVWHATYEYRQSPLLAYYDMRNSMIVNAMYGFLTQNEEFRNYSMNTILNYHQKREYQKEYFSIRAVIDFLKGMEWFLHVPPENHQLKILSHKRFGKQINYTYQLYLRYRFRKKEQIVNMYQKEKISNVRDN